MERKTDVDRPDAPAEKGEAPAQMELEPGELEEQQAHVLPKRELMSIVDPQWEIPPPPLET